jgi:hypothetical protein
MRDDLKSYVVELDDDSRVYEDEFPLRDEAFAAHVINEISELINLDEPQMCHGTVTDSAGRVRGEIYGYSLSENKEVLTLFYALYNPTSNMEITTLQDAEYQSAINKMQGFYNSAVRGLSLDLEDDGKTSSKLYEPAKAIYENYQTITSIRLLVLSNSIINKYEIKNNRINGKITTADVWDLKKIYANLHSGLDHAPIDVDFTSEDYRRYKIPYIKMDSNDFDYQCVIALFPGKLLYQLYERHNTDLLLNNVRFFLGFKGSKKNNANIGILNTLKTESQRFLAYNNGITALASGVESDVSGGSTYDVSENEGGHSSNDLISTGVLKAIRDFRIVNGGQTTAALFNSKHGNPSISLYGVYVQVKIIVLSKDINQVAGRITQYSNSQSKIKYSDFTVSNNFNMTMEKLSRSILIPNKNNDPKYWYFERVRGQYDQEKKNIRTKEELKYFESKYAKERRFKKEEIAKVWKSWEQEPFDAVKGESTNYELYMSKHADFTPDENYYRKTIALIIVYRFLMSRPENKQYGNRKATIVTYCIACLNYYTYGKLNLEKIWKEQDLSDDLKKYLMQLCEAINEALIRLAGDIAVLSWGKRKQSFKEIIAQDLKCDKSLLDSETDW